MSYYFCSFQIWELAQPSINELPTDQYEQIRIKGVLFVDIKNTYGNILEMEKLLGKAEVSVSGKEIGEETREFKYENGLQISFGDFDLKNDKPELFYLKTNNIFIKNVNLSIGNSIEKLGKDIIFNKDKDGSFFNYVHAYEW